MNILAACTPECSLHDSAIKWGENRIFYGVYELCMRHMWCIARFISSIYYRNSLLYCCRSTTRKISAAFLFHPLLHPRLFNSCICAPCALPLHFYCFFSLQVESIERPRRIIMLVQVRFLFCLFDWGCSCWMRR